MRQVHDYDPRTGDFLQGDLCIFPIPESIRIAAGAVEISPIDGRLVLQEGEVTGHHHAIALPQLRHFRDARPIAADPAMATRSPRLRRALGGGRQRAADETVPTARLYRDPAAIAALVTGGELTRTDLAIGILVIEGGPIVLGHEEHDGGRLPHAWTDVNGNARRGRYYVGRQVESLGADERVVRD